MLNGYQTGLLTSSLQSVTRRQDDNSETETKDSIEKKISAAGTFSIDINFQGDARETRQRVTRINSFDIFSPPSLYPGIILSSLSTCAYLLCLLVSSQGNASVPISGPYDGIIFTFGNYPHFYDPNSLPLLPYVLHDFFPNNLLYTDLLTFVLRWTPRTPVRRPFSSLTQKMNTIVGSSDCARSSPSLSWPSIAA
ncbi:hypothetical protein H2248_000862 [Termitomyces sp. 'cryptogamus']|nr:hypothetical protein H2248_000862 [Termitomyces sp. 'cryptogamus']